MSRIYRRYEPRSCRCERLALSGSAHTRCNMLPSAVRAVASTVARQASCRACAWGVRERSPATIDCHDVLPTCSRRMRCYAMPYAESSYSATRNTRGAAAAAAAAPRYVYAEAKRRHLFLITMRRAMVRKRPRRYLERRYCRYERVEAATR